MKKRELRRKVRKLFLLLSMVTIVFANFISVIPVQRVYAEEVIESKDLEQTEPGVNDPAQDDVLTESQDQPNQEQQEEKLNEEKGQSSDVETTVKETIEKEVTQQSEVDIKEPTQTVEQSKETESIQAPVVEEDRVEEPIVETTETVEEDYTSNPQLLITEISPDSKGTDNYEFFEVYNNTNQPLSLTNYQFIYHYTDTGKETTFPIPATTIESQETLVFWYNKAGLNVADFNSHYGLQLTSEQVIEYMDGFPGFANGGNRAAVIKDQNGNEVTSAGYLPGETNNTGLVVQYKYQPAKTAMEKLQVLADPSPGTIDAIQVPTKPVELAELPADGEAPIIDHSAITEGKALAPIKIEAIVTDNRSTQDVTLHYKNEGDTSFTSLSMIRNTENQNHYSVEIPGAQVQTNLVYYLKATDGTHTVKTEENLISVEIPEETYSEQQLLITELSPNSTGGGTDYYEYFELYNNTNQPLPISNYSFVYKYTDSGNEVVFQVPTTTIEPKETLVFWFNNGERTLAEFNTNFESGLTSDNVIEYKSSFPGFANGGNRALLIKDNAGTEIVSASYLAGESDNTGVGIQYLFPNAGTEMEKLQTLAIPTPGTIEEIQVPTKPVELEEAPTDTEAPVITHTPVKESDAFLPIVIEVSVNDDKAVPFATLHYKKEGEDTFTSLSMNTSTDSSTYTAEIPGTSVDASITYYLEASDGTNVAKTEEYKITVKKEEVDTSKIPKFLVTEVVPDTANVGSADGYEFIEIYNNTDKDLNFGDYKIQYRYGTDPASDVVWPSIPDDVVIPSKETLVFWIINSMNGEQTVADFNAHFATNLVENKDIVKIQSDGMANGSTRGLVVATNTKEEITVSYYNEVANVDDTVPDKGIIYKYPEDGSTQSSKISAGIQDATPGAVESYQVPNQPVHIIDDSAPPTIINKTAVTEVNQTDDIEISAEANDNVGVKTVRLFYRTNDQESFNETLLALDSESQLYKNMIYASDLIAKEYVEYFFVASDGTNEVKSDAYRIDIKSEIDNSDLRLNVKNEDILSGKKVLKGTSKVDGPDDVSLSIDHQKIQEDTHKSLETQAYLALEVNGLNTYFQNAVTMGDDILFLMDKDWLSHWKTFTIPVEADRLKIGDNTLTVRAGNKASPFQLDENEENRDDYNIRNVRLILADGTVLRDTAKADPVQVYDMGDDGTYRPFEDFTFAITDDHTHSKTYTWDTTQVADGEHVVKAEDKDDEVSSTILVDNTAPVIDTTINEGKEYKGAFTIDTDVTDEIAGVHSVQVMLDNEQIEVPYETASSQLEPGEHQLKISAVDKVGNEAELIVPFSVNNENPNKPELISPTNGSATLVDGDPTLKVKVTDPTGDNLDVTFFEGYQYDASNTSDVKAYKHANDIEPPQTMVPEGEEALTTEDRSLVSETDGKYLTTDSSTQFPYHRFDVTVDPSVDENDRIELSWRGNSFEGRKVSMYAWSHESNQWELITYKIAGTEDFDLTGNVTGKEFIKDSKINVLVQDEIPSSSEDYDYTFVWMSDTQYYAESYPHIFERQTNWIAEKQEELKIDYVFHTGDLVDNFDQVSEWNYADEYMGVLDENNIPYGVLAGNHDVDQLSNDYREYYKYFGEDRFEDKSYYGDSYKNNRGHYDLISSNGNDFIMVYMGWGVQDEDLEWMNDILSQYPDRKAILSFHEYLLVSGNRSPLGNDIFEKVVETNENVIAVLSGHYHDSETLVSEIDDDGDGVADREVYQMLGDYQGGPEGGQGYMKLLHFDQDNNRIIVNTYSPYLDDYNFYDPVEFPGKDELIINLDLQVDEKRVATDYFAVNIKTDTEIGKQKKTPSGNTAEVTWKGLTENNTYSWYAVAEDGYTGKTTSDIWTFTKGENNQPEGPGDGGSDKPDEGTDGPDGGSDKPDKGTDGPDGGSDKPDKGTDGPDGGSDKPDKGTNGPKDGSDNLKDGSKKPESPTNKDDYQKNGFGLPSTATNLFNLIVIGAIIFAVGGFLIFIQRKRTRLKQQ